MMSRFKLTARIAIVVGLAVATGVFLAAMFSYQIYATSERYDALMAQDEVQQQDQARVMQVSFKKQVQEWKDLLLRGYKFDDFQKYQGNFKNQETVVRKQADDLLKAVKDEEVRKQLQAFVAAHEAMGKTYAAAMVTFEKSKGLDFTAADALVKGQDRAPTDAIDKIVTGLQQDVVTRRTEESDSVHTTINRAVMAAGVVFAIIVAVAFFMVRGIRGEMVTLTNELATTVDGTAASASLVATSAQSLSQGATEQAASLEETSASMEEMAAMTRKNAQNSQTAAGLMGEIDTRVQESNVALGEMVTSMGEIQAASEQVAKIIKTIDEIAFQTNILALNAAVEAARAGEAGMGFAVVADEVRNLAQRSAQAARDTASLIESSLEKSQRGAEKVETVAGSIASITSGVGQVKGLIEEVSLASSQQAQGIDQVSQAVSQMEKVTQTTAATAEESAAASEELSAQAEAAMGVVTHLENLVGTVAPRKAQTAPASRHASSAVVRMADVKRAGRPVSRPATSGSTAEDFLPLENTGTFGKF